MITIDELAEALILACNRRMLDTDNAYEPVDGFEAQEAAKRVIDRVAAKMGSVGPLPTRDQPDYCVRCRGIHWCFEGCESRLP